MNYHSIYKDWQADPESFWMEAAENIDWEKKPTFALNDSNAPLFEWYTDSYVNTCFNALDRHVDNGRGDQTAIIYDSPITEKKRTYFLCRTAKKNKPFSGLSHQ